MAPKSVWISYFVFIFVACTNPSQEEADTNVDRDADEKDVVQDQDTDNPQDTVESQDFDVYDRPDTTIHDVVDGPDDFQELEDVQNEEEVRDTTEPTWDIDEEIRNSTGYQECLAQYNDVVQQALQDLPDVPEPEPDNTLDTFTQLSLGQNHGCALHTDGSLYCWGDNRYRQSEPPTEGRFVQVVSRYNTSCALEDTGRAVCWGEYANDEIPGDYIKISNGCGLLQDQSIYCWDYWDLSGQFIPGSYTNVSVQVQLCMVNDQGVPSCLDGDGDPYLDENRIEDQFISAESNWLRTCGETVDHRIKCWSDYEFMYGRSKRVNLFKLKVNDEFIAVYQDNTWEWGGEYSGYSLESYDQLDRTQFIDIDTNETQHCAIDGQGLLQCWTKRGYKKQNLLYDRFLDYDFGCAVMQDHSLYCENDSVNENESILFLNTQSLTFFNPVRAGISENKDIYYWIGNFSEEHSYYFQGPYENIITEFEYFCGIDENNNIECQCLCYPGLEPCTSDCNLNAKYFYENYKNIKKNCGLNSNGILNCWNFENISSIRNTLLGENKAVNFNFNGSSLCSINCQGNIYCTGPQENQNYINNNIFKSVLNYRFSENYFCSIDVLDHVLCESENHQYRLSGKFNQILTDGSTLCAQRENGSVICLGQNKGGK
jgi:hypothetical protein